MTSDENRRVVSHTHTTYSQEAQTAMDKRLQRIGNILRPLIQQVTGVCDEMQAIKLTGMILDSHTEHELG